MVFASPSFFYFHFKCDFTCYITCKKLYQQNYYIINTSHTKFIKTINKIDKESRSISDEDVGNSDNSIEEFVITIIFIGGIFSNCTYTL